MERQRGEGISCGQIRERQRGEEGISYGQIKEQERGEEGIGYGQIRENGHTAEERKGQVSIKSEKRPAG